MKLLTREIIQKMPPLGTTAQKSSEEIPVICKFFLPEGRWTWFICEGSLTTEDGTEKALKDCSDAELNDPKNDIIFFGYCWSGLGSDCDELGNVSFNELKSVKTKRFKLPIERDLHFPVGGHMVSEFMK